MHISHVDTYVRRLLTPGRQSRGNIARARTNCSECDFSSPILFHILLFPGVNLYATTVATEIAKRDNIAKPESHRDISRERGREKEILVVIPITGEHLEEGLLSSF